MATTTPGTTRTAVSAATVKWIEGNFVGAYNCRGFCVRKGDTYLSMAGDGKPSVWTRKSTATIVADTLTDDDAVQWVPAWVGA